MKDFCIGTLPNASNVGIVKLTEDLGYSHHGVGDGPLLFSDPFVYLGAVAQQTSTIELGTYVVNPLTRIPAVLANAHATLNVLAPGRVFAGLGTANNATRSMGVRQAKIAEVEEGMRQVRALNKGERIENHWLGKTKDIEYIAQPEHGWINIDDDIPVWMAAGGPRALDVAAKYSDAIVYATGTDPSMIRLVRRLIDEACEGHGRDPKEVKLVALSWFALRKPGDTIEDVMRDGFGNGAVISGDSNNALVTKYADELPEEMVEFSNAAKESYLPKEGDKPMDHLEVFKTHANGVIAQRHIELTTEEAAKFWCLWGDYEEVAARVEGMREAGAEIPSVVLANPMNYDRDAKDLAKALNDY